MIRRVVHTVALGIAALVAGSAAGATEPRDVHINVGSSRAPLMATVRVEDYRAAPIDLLTSAATADSLMTRFLKTYYEIGKAGDIKRVASLFEPHLRDGVNNHYNTTQALSEPFADLRTARMVAVLHWGEYQFGLVEHEGAVEKGSTSRYSWAHAARCVSDTCRITDHFENGLLGRVVAAAFIDKDGAQVEVPAQNEMPLRILPAAGDTATRTVVIDPIVLHLNRSSDQTTRAVSKAVPVPSNVSSVYSLGPDVCVALLKSGQGREVRWIPLQRVDNEWVVISDPSRLDAWPVLSSISTYQALQSR